jgi:hypothetical protein
VCGDARGEAVSAQLALALLAVGALKGGGVPAKPESPSAGARPALPSREPHDPIALLAREWLAKR